MQDEQTLASTRHDWMTEQGSIEIGGTELQVVKQGFMSGQWTLNAGDEVIATATKPSAMTRRFELAAFDASWIVAASAFTRCFDLELHGETVAQIKPDHPFTRRSSIKAEDLVPIEVLALSFWLAILCWKRAASTSGG